MAKVLEVTSGRDMSRDVIDPTSEYPYLGDADADGATPTYKLGPTDFSNAFQDAPGLTEKVIDLKNLDTLVLLIDYVKGAGTGCQIRVLFGETDDAAKLTEREPREDNGPAGLTRHEAIDHEFTASVRTRIFVNRLARFAKIQAKSLGTPDATDKLAISALGQTWGG